MNNLNLLPLAIKKEIRKNTHYIELINSLILITLALIVLTLFLVMSQKYLHFRLNDMARMESSSEEYTRVAEINGNMAELADIQDTYVKWSRVLVNFLELVPENITLNNVYFDKQDNSIILNGSAKARDDFLKFKESLEASDLVTEIESPISNLLHQTDIDFTLEAELHFN